MLVIEQVALVVIGCCPYVMRFQYFAILIILGTYNEKNEK